MVTALLPRPPSAPVTRKKKREKRSRLSVGRDARLDATFSTHPEQFVYAVGTSCWSVSGSSFVCFSSVVCCVVDSFVSSERLMMRAR